jgi:hypothetical protein
MIVERFEKENEYPFSLCAITFQMPIEKIEPRFLADKSEYEKPRYRRDSNDKPWRSGPRW